MVRIDGRKPNEVRGIKVIPHVQKDPDGSVLIQWGKTHVLCSVIIESKLPNWMSNSDQGWITAEYGMLPGCSDKRIQRDKIRSTGRTHEIQRLIGRSIRTCMDLKTLGPRTVQIDCDVIQADGGTRVASVTGSYLALRLALDRWTRLKKFSAYPQSLLVGAVSLGKVGGEYLLDLCYEEDVKAEVDANLVMNEKGEFIEIQSTAEKGSFSLNDWNAMLELGRQGMNQVFDLQRTCLSEWGLRP